MNKLAMLVAALFLVACSTSKPIANQQDGNASKTSAATASSAVAASATSPNTMTAAEVEAAKLAAELQTLHNERVYFDYNQYSLKPDVRAIIEKQAANFKNMKHGVLVLQGNADERGSDAYNFALGEKRASSVKKALVALGVAPSKIKTVSFGKSKPKLDCHEEKCWKENRRVDFVVKQK